MANSVNFGKIQVFSLNCAEGILHIRLGTGTLPMTLTPINLYLCANTHAREGGRGAGERSALYTSTLD